MLNAMVGMFFITMMKRALDGIYSIIRHKKVVHHSLTTAIPKTDSKVSAPSDEPRLWSARLLRGDIEDLRALLAKASRISSLRHRLTDPCSFPQ
jgi:hypothetical protein